MSSIDMIAVRAADAIVQFEIARDVCGHAMLKHAQSEGTKRVQTSIVARNYCVLNIYARLEFKFSPPLMIFHWVQAVQ